MDRWRDQRRDTKHSEVAGEVLVVTLRYLTTLDSATSPAVIGTAEMDQDRASVFRADIQRRVAAIEAVQTQVLRAWEQAETYLPEEINEFMERVWQTGNDIRWSQATCAELPPNHTEHFYQEMFKSGFGPAPKKRIAELRIEGRQRLRPLAQLTNEQPSRSQKARELDETKAKQIAERAAKGLPPSSDK